MVSKDTTMAIDQTLEVEEILDQEHLEEVSTVAEWVVHHKDLMVKTICNEKQSYFSD